MKAFCVYCSKQPKHFPVKNRTRIVVFRIFPISGYPDTGKNTGLTQNTAKHRPVKMPKTSAGIQTETG